MTQSFGPTIAMLLVLLTSSVGAVEETGVLKGRITDQGGCPVAGVLVTVATEKGVQIASAKTSLDGTYSFPHTSTGLVRVSAALTGFVTIETHVFVYRGENIWDSNLYVNSIEGMKRHQVAGTVRSLSSGPVTDATVTLINAVSGERLEQIRTDKAGKYLFSVRAGDYVVTASGVGRGAAASFVTFAEEGGGTAKVDLTLKEQSSCDHRKP